MAVAPMSRGHVNTIHAWIFFGITVAEAIANCALEGVLFYFVASTIDIRASKIARTIPTYLAIYILAFLFQAVFTFLAIRQRNTIQIIGLVIFNACFVAYSAVQITEIPDLLQDESYEDITRKMRPILIIIPVITGIAQIFYVYLSYKIYQDFGWLVFKRLGADRKIHRYYFYYEIFACLLKFDFFFFVGFSMQLLILNISFTDVEAWLTLAAIPVAIVFIFLAVWSVKNEIHWLQVLFDLAIVAGAGYFGLKLYRIWGDDTKAIYQNDQKSLTIFASIALVLMVCTFFVSVVCQINFGKGLKRYLVPQKDKDNGHVEYDLEEDTSYGGSRNSPVSSQGKQPRVLLE